jgi:hypothetical protein
MFVAAGPNGAGRAPQVLAPMREGRCQTSASRRSGPRSVDEGSLLLDPEDLLPARNRLLCCRGLLLRPVLWQPEDGCEAPLRVSVYCILELDTDDSPIL